MLNLLNIIIVFILVFLNAFFVATEFAMVKVRKSRIETLVAEGDKSAMHTLTVVNDLNLYLSGCQLGITLASLGLGWVGEPAVAHMLEPLFELFHMPASLLHTVSFILGFSIITSFHIVLGELVPKSLAITSAEKIAMKTAYPLMLFYKVSYPVMWAFNNTTNLILKVFGVSQAGEHDAAHTDQEIKLLVAQSYEQGLVDKSELTLVDNIFDFSETTVKDIMVPRTDMECIFAEDSFDDIIAYALGQQLTRYPVCMDSKDNIIGFVHIKDLYKKKIEDTNPDIRDIIREVKFVPESMSISELLMKFKKEKAQMVVINDEYGGTSGLVTIEDVLEEIVGEIHDEFDMDEGSEITKTEEGGYIIDGKVLLEDINQMLDMDIDAENIDTIGGWVYSELKKYPAVKDKIQYADYDFIVLECDDRRINKVQIKKISKG
jgi:CBS domain containing-hemolysin-like protein